VSEIVPANETQIHCKCNSNSENSISNLRKVVFISSFLPPKIFPLYVGHLCLSDLYLFSSKHWFV
jgi:hypothetical protein